MGTEEPPHSSVVEKSKRQASNKGKSSSKDVPKPWNTQNSPTRRMKDLYNENFKVRQKLKCLKLWSLPCSWIGRLNIMKWLLLKTIFKALSIKCKWYLYTTAETILKIPWKIRQQTGNKSNPGGITVSDIRGSHTNTLAAGQHVS